MNETFFRFRGKLVLANFTASPVDNPKEYVNLIRGNYDGFEFPVIFKQVDGKKITDILDTGFPGLYLMSDRLVEILKNNGFTGWKAYPAIVYDKKGNEVKGYEGLSVTGRSGPLHYDESSIFEKRYLPNGPLCKCYKGEFVSRWDGSDFFIPENTTATIVTKKVADELKKNKITNLGLESLEDAERNVRY